MVPRHARWALVFAFAIAAVTALGFATSGFANTCPTGLSNSPWDACNAANESAGDAGTALNDLASGSGDDSFTGGTSENDANVKLDTGSIPPNKSDLKTFWTAVGTGSDNHVYLYLAWSRYNNTGTVDVDFELNQQAQTLPTYPYKNSPMTINRTAAVFSGSTLVSAGDLLVTYDFQGSGSPVLGTYMWGGTAWAAAGTNVANSSDASVSSDGLFGEAVIDLTGSGLLPAGQCEQASTAWLKSRSSTNFTNEMKDFIVGNPQINTCQPASVTVHKQDSGSTNLSGAVFQLFKESNNTAGLQTGSGGDTQVQTNCTTDNTGACGWTGLTVGGTYYVYELTAPANYALANPRSQVVTITITGTATDYPVTFHDPPLYKIVVFTCNNATGAPVVGSVSVTGGSLGSAATKDTDAILGSSGSPSLAQQVCANSYSGDATTPGSGASFPDLTSGTYSASIQDPKP